MRSWRGAGAVMMAVLGGLALASPAIAQDLPSDSAIDQYTENIPAPTGNTPTAGAEGKPLPPAAQRALENLGTVGESTAALTAATTRTGEARVRGRDGKEAIETRRVDRGGFSAVIDQLVDPLDSGTGIWLPLVLVATFVAGVVFAARRRRGSS